MEAYNGGSHITDRVGRGTIQIGNLHTVVCGGMQIDKLLQYKDLTDDGLLQRFLSIIAPSAQPGVDAPATDAVRGYEALLRALVNAPNTTLQLSDAALQERQDVEKRLYEIERSEVLGEKFAGFCGKLVGVWGRLCLVLHCTRPIPVSGQTELGELVATFGSSEVDEATAKAATKLIFESVIPNAAKVYMLMAGEGENDNATQAIAGYILARKSETLRIRELAKNVRECRNKSSKDIAVMASPLVAGSWLEPHEGGGGWHVNPGVHRQFAARAEREKARREALRKLIVGGLRE